MRKRKTLEQFITEARAVHGYTYDYSDVVYVQTHRKVWIYCHTHGYFDQTPSKHKNGQGCRICFGDRIRNRQLRTKSEFVIVSNEIHNNRYTYDNAVYINDNEKVLITCSIHGDFPQSPANHHMGDGCPKCARMLKSLNSRRSHAEFVRLASLKHDNKYTYDNVKYFANCIKISITCSHHGDFSQLPTMHLRGQGCPKCAAKKLYRKYKGRSYN